MSPRQQPRFGLKKKTSARDQDALRSILQMGKHSDPCGRAYVQRLLTISCGLSWSLSAPLCLFRQTSVLTADTLECAFVKLEIQDTREREIKQKNATLAKGESTKRETPHQAARSSSHNEFGTCSWQTLRQRTSLFQSQHHRRCPFRDDGTATGIFSLCSLWHRSRSLQRNRGPSSHVTHGSEAWWPAAHSKKVAQLRQLDHAACVLCNAIR